MKRKEGQAMVEFALVLPIIILLICGMIDFGWIFGNQIILNNATREAARYTAIHYKDSDYSPVTVEGIVGNKATTFEDPPQVIITPDTDVEEITIVTQGDIRILTPLTPIFLDDYYPLTAKSVMRIE